MADDRPYHEDLMGIIQESRCRLRTDARMRGPATLATRPTIPAQNAIALGRETGCPSDWAVHSPYAPTAATTP